MAARASAARTILAATILIVLSAPARLRSDDKPKYGAKSDMEWGVKVPMRDGIGLNATVYRPH